jgi:hypothetical protein
MKIGEFKCVLKEEKIDEYGIEYSRIHLKAEKNPAFKSDESSVIEINNMKISESEFIKLGILYKIEIN